jgi:indole-3-glycerol phosphate synthase
MPIFLEEIVSATRVRVAERKRVADRKALEQAAYEHRPRGFLRALQTRAATGPAIIAELKKASPSKGLLRPHLAVEDIAREYAQAGATALSILTEPDFFQGSLENLRTASAAVELPCLQKDFIVEEFQLVEARAHGADAVLLLAPVLSDSALACLNGKARALGLDVLCEVHDESQLQRALAAGCDLIGVNNRDLRTFKVDLETAIRLSSQIPSGVMKVAESGIHTAEDLRRLQAAGYSAFLIGESFMRAPSPGEALAELLRQATANAEF